MLDLKKEFSLSDEQMNQFKEYYNLLIEWNNKINLTAITDYDDVMIKHYYDSLTVKDYIQDNDKIIDIGTGAGFPGIPLKILKNNIKLTLADSLNKRVIFLNEIVQKIKLKNVEIIHGRAEEIGQDKNYREKYDVVISRAVANMSVLSEYLIPLTKLGGISIFMKGPNIKEEIENSKKAIQILGGEIVDIKNFKLYNTDIERNIIIIKKIKTTEKRFPRNSGVPSKSPLK